jgi:choline dehydrogenase-like flavoprotein
MNASPDELVVRAPHFAERVHRNQQQLRSELKAQYDFNVCGSRSSGPVVTRRLAENADVSVLLLEAGGPDDLPTVMRAEQWPLILGSEQDWNFAAQPPPQWAQIRAVSAAGGRQISPFRSLATLFEPHLAEIDCDH